MTFPVLSETFILREIVELRRRGVDLRIFAIRRPDTSVVHPDAEAQEPWVLRVPYLSARVLGTNLSTFLRGPRRYLGALGELVRHNRKAPRALAKALLLFPKSVVFAAEAQRLGVEHVHALYSGVPASAALVVHRLTGLPFSFAVRSSKNLYIENHAIVAKLEAASFAKAVTELYRQDLLDSRRYWGRDMDRFCDRFPEEKVAVVRSSVDLEVYRPRTQEPPGRRIVAVGRLDDHKGFRYLIDAFAILRDRGVDFDAEIIGEGHLRGDLEQRLRDRDLTDRVRLPGAKPQEEVRERYLTAKAVAVSSLWEGVPNVLMESLALGVPAAATAVSGIPELIRDGETGLLVPPKDPAALADALERLLDDEALRARLATGGRRAVEEEFGIQHNADRILAQFHAHSR